MRTGAKSIGVRGGKKPMTIEEMKARKQALGLTNQDIATLTGVPLGTVQKVFAGITTSPRYGTVLALEKILGDDNVLMRERKHQGGSEAGTGHVCQTDG